MLLEMKAIGLLRDVPRWRERHAHTSPKLYELAPSLQNVPGILMARTCGPCKKSNKKWRASLSSIENKALCSKSQPC